MLQHVSIEVAPDEAEALIEFWHLVGFEPVAAPDALGDHVRWVECRETQVHLILTDGATAPVLGHSAVVVGDFEATVARVSAAGHEIFETDPLWGARRAFAIAPGGHRVELMEFPPPPGRGLG